MIRSLLAILLLSLASLPAADLKVAVLHPLLADLVGQIGQEHVDVIDLIGPNGDPHHFEPRPADLKRAEQATLYLASGMGLEDYLPKLRAIIAGKARLVEVGATLPSLEGACDHDHDHGDDHHHHHATDPHWWHSIDLFRRAASIVAEELGKENPSRAGEFARNAEAYRARLQELERWAKREIAKIPRDRRQLATAHAAFNYFCKDFGFTPFSVQGLNREQMPDAARLASLVGELKSNRVAAIFPERESNPKILQTLTRDTGIRLGEPLIADGSGVTNYEAMMRENIEHIVAALESDH